MPTKETEAMGEPTPEQISENIARLKADVCRCEDTLIVLRDELAWYEAGRVLEHADA